MAYSILQCLYVDDGAFPFRTRDDLQRGIELIYHHFVRFGLESTSDVAPRSQKLSAFSPLHLSSSNASNKISTRLA